MSRPVYGTGYPIFGHVALFTRRVEAAREPHPNASGDDTAAASLNLAPTSVWWDTYIARDTAMTVPAYRRAIQLVSGSISTLKLSMKDAAQSEIAPIPFLRQPDPKVTTQSLLAKTVADLCHFGFAYWYNPNWNLKDGWRFPDTRSPKHKSIIRVAPEDVALIRTESVTLYVYDRQGIPHPVEVPPEAVIIFEAPAGHWLKDGARALSTMQMLEDAVRMYAQTPLPQTVVKNQGARKTSEDVEKLLSAIESARVRRSTAYVGRDLELDTMGWDAQQIALAEARAQQVLEISRLSGIPPLYLAQGIQGSSHNYSNLTQQRLDLHAALVPFTTAIAQRLSFDDVTGNGFTVDFDYTPWLRVDPTMRADLYAKLIPLGVMTADEARAFEQLTPTPNMPTQTDPAGGIEGPPRTGTTP